MIFWSYYVEFPHGLDLTYDVGALVGKLDVV